MALSSWNGVYSAVEQRFMRKRRYKLFFLLKALCQHADEFGLSYPGDELLKELTGIGSQLQLNESLQFLVDGEYVKIWESWNPRRRAYDRDFQVSPFVIYIREELQGYAEKLWHTGERDFDYESSIVNKLNGQPESEPESESRIINQNHQPSPPPRQHSRQATDARSANDYANQAEGQQRKRRKPTAGKARATEKEPAHAGSPPPDKIDLRKYQSPLPHNQEDRAQDLALSFRMKISQARGLVATYGEELVGTAAHAVQDAMRRGAATNPAGLLTYLLKKGGINVQDERLYQDNDMAAETARMLIDD